MPPKSRSALEPLDGNPRADGSLSLAERIDRKTLPFSESESQSGHKSDGRAEEAGAAITKRSSPGESGKKTSTGLSEQLGEGGNPGNGRVLDPASSDTSRSNGKPERETNPSAGKDSTGGLPEGGLAKGIALPSEEAREVLRNLAERIGKIALEVQELSESLVAATSAVVGFAKAVGSPMEKFPTRGKHSSWELSYERLESYKEMYPDMDVLKVLARARQWLLDNPSRRKTAKGMPNFCSGWLERQQNKGAYPKRAPKGAPPTPPYVDQGYRSFEEWRVAVTLQASDEEWSDETKEEVLAFVNEQERGWAKKC